MGTRPATRRRCCTASTLPLDRRDPPWPRLSRGCTMLMLSSTPSWCPPPPLMLLHCSTWLPTLVWPWESTSETTACTPSSSSTTCPSRPWPTDRCPCCSDVPQAVRLTPVTSSTSTLVCWREQPRCPMPWGVAPSLPSLSLRPRLVTYLPTSQPMSSPSLTDRSSWRLSSSTKVSDQQLMLVCLCPVSDLLPRPSL